MNFTTPTALSLYKKLGIKMVKSAFIFPAIFLDHVSQFNNEFAFLVFLARFIGLFIFPAKDCLATITVYISHCMQSGEEYSFLSLAAANVDHRVEQIGSALAALGLNKTF